MKNKLKNISRGYFLKVFGKFFLSLVGFITFPFARSNNMNEKNILNIIELPKSGPWRTNDPFLFCVHHYDRYPKANKKMGPDDELYGRRLGNDFSNINGWSMYHGKEIPGFPRHPHRGFETITIVEKGLVDHSDSMGYTARYGDGDVQWLTAGDGIQHSEMFPLLDQKESNPIDFFQIWINLKSDKKRVKPNFSMFWKEEIPKVIDFDHRKRKISVEIIAGNYKNYDAPNPPKNSWANSKDNEVNIWKINLEKRANWEFPKVNEGISRTIYIYGGIGISLENQIINSGYMVEIKSNQKLSIKSLGDETKLLLLQARPINEPVVQYGPFVMNSKKEIQEAFNDYNETSFGGWNWDEDGPVHGKKYEKFAIGDN